MYRWLLLWVHSKYKDCRMEAADRETSYIVLTEFNFCSIVGRHSKVTSVAKVVEKN